MACTSPLAMDAVGLVKPQSGLLLKDLAREYCMGRPRDSTCHGLVIPCINVTPWWIWRRSHGGYL
jgi:hypothetical protein